MSYDDWLTTPPPMESAEDDDDPRDWWDYDEFGDGSFEAEEE